jgi:hypothetical protein
MPIVWKQDERDFAAWGCGARQSSRGQVEADVMFDKFTLEHKSRSRDSFPAWLEKAFDQAKVNKRLYPEKEALVGLSVHYGRGTKTRRFLCIEVNFDDDQWDERTKMLIAKRDEIERELAALAQGKEAVSV